ncbi:MAG TPA: penicillin-binding protein 2 [Pseudomonadales bacterium]|nr:penicillin-binding protein 2 [Pseudomonadales bacterium]
MNASTDSLPGRWRLLCIGAVLLALTLGVAVRVVMLQGEQERAFLQRQGDARTVRNVALQASRGVVFDRRGEPLAVSTPVASVWVNPQRVDRAAPDLAQLAALLDMRRPDLDAKLADSGSREFVYLRRQVDPAVAEQIARLDLPGVELEEEYKRFYPAGEVAAHLVGITNVDDVGIEGIELAYDDWLAGTPGRKRVIRDRRGHVVRDLEYVRTTEPGRDLSLSIDLRLQYLAYRELKAAMAQYSAESATMVVLDVATGEILAMVNQPGYNPNAPVTSNLERLRNRAVTDLYEPGSTVKPLTVAAALETGRFTSESIIDTSPGWIRIAGKVIKDPLDRGPMTLGQIIAKSSQVGISHVALDLEDETLRELFGRFGFGVVTGIGFPGEAAGRMPVGHDWPLIERITLAYGYGLSVTPLQLAQAYTVFATGGEMRTPTLLRTEPDAAPLAARPVLSPAIAAQMTSMLEDVVRKEGTAAKAAIAGYRVAGKTGTVRKVGPGGYDDERHIGYFVGFAPVSAPRVTAVVVINEPRVEHSGGGAVAAPVFARVVAGALRLLNVPPDAGTDPEAVAERAAAAPRPPLLQAAA